MSDKRTYVIEVKAQDGKTMQKLSVEASSAGKALEQVSKGAHSADRQLKGASQQSANSTKNFSKMAQGISGGLVPAYATLAAQLFAVSAAFQFLKKAGDLAVLREGQVAYAAATGIALRSLANDISAASDAQLGFVEASQGAAKGIAAGLSPETLTDIARGAKNVSVMLGRDVTDSFNRLVDGITKANPNLLDELGIILRLDDAVKKYADSIGKNDKELSSWERTQALATEALGQLESTYGDVMDIVQPSVNVFNQLGKTFSDVIMSMKRGVATLMGPLAETFIQFPQLATAGFVLLLKNVAQAIAPELTNITKRATHAAEAAKEAFLAMDKDIKRRSKMTTAEYVSDITKTNTAAMQELLKGMKFKETSGFFALQTDGKVTAQQLAGMEQAVKKGYGQFASISESTKTQMIKHLEEMRVATRKNTDQMVLDFEKFKAQATSRQAQIEVFMKRSWSNIAGFVAGFARVVSIALYWASILGVLVTAGITLYNAITRNNKVIDTQAKYMENLRDKIKTLNEEYLLFTEVQNRMNDAGDRTLGFLEAFGQRISSLGALQMQSMLDQISEELPKIQKEFETVLRAQQVAPPEWARNLLTPIVPTEWLRNRLGLASSEFAEFAEQGKLVGQSIAYLNQQVKALEESNDDLAKNSRVFSNYINLVKEFLASSSPGTLVDQVVAAHQKVVKLTGDLANLNRLSEDNRKASSDLIKAFMPDSEYDRAISNLIEEQTTLLAVLEDVGELAEAEQAARDRRLATIQKEIDLFRELNTQEHRNSIIKERLKALETQALRGQTTGQSALISADFEARGLQQQIQELQDQARLVEGQLNDPAVDGREAKIRALQLNHENLWVLQEQLATLERSRDTMMQLHDAAAQGLETGVQQGLASLIKGDQSSFRDAILTIAQTTVSSVADTLAKQLTDVLMGKNPIAIAAKQAQIISTSFLNAGSAVASMLSAAMLGTPVTAITSGGLGPPLETTMKTGGFAKAIAWAKDLLPGFANGGIVHKPTIAQIGEGKYSEAVVPLPDGKRIPVDLGSGGGATTNNVSVDVHVTGSGQATSNVTGDSASGSALGNVIAQAVQRELQNQKRSGGILNPYGTA